MANLKISQLPTSSNPLGDELIASVQGGVTKQLKINQILDYITPVSLTVEAGQTINLVGSTYDEAEMIRLHWNGVNGTMTLNLPDATQNTNRLMRFVSNGGFATATRVELTATGGQTIDGSVSPYVINKGYEGIQLWSDGVEWFIIQKKA